MARLPLVSPLDRVLFLKAQPYLEGLPSSTLATIAEYTEERFFAKNEVFVSPDTPSEHIYFLASGGVRMRYAASAPFDVFSPGGIGLVEHLARREASPQASALEDTMALAVDAGSFLQILEDDFGLFHSIVTQIARRTFRTLFLCGPKRPAESGFPDDFLLETFATLDLVHRLAQAREAPFFAGSNLTVLAELIRFQDPRVVRAGEALFEEGATVDSMALVLDGSFIADGGGGETLHPAGSMVGGWEIFTDHPRRETTRALTTSRIIEIERTHFADVLEDHFEFATDYLRKLCRRLVELKLAVPA